jgi:signal transduction histidine kinase
MDENKLKISELEEKLGQCSSELEVVVGEQQKAAKLLIRRDLALSKANEKLQALDEAKSEFISVAAHQLRTPLSAIKWILHMLVNNEFKSDDERAQFTEKALVSTDRMIGLVNDLLEVDHIQSGKDQFVFTKCEINPIIESIVSEFKAIADEKHVEIRTDIAQGPKIFADTVKIRALLQNLIENGIKYTPSNGSIRIVTNYEDSFIKVAVSDTGIGIPESQKSQIFSKFFRADNAMRQETVGSGLGLFIAKQVAERHGGKLWFESKMGEGTSFFVTLPISTIAD